MAQRASVVFVLGSALALFACGRGSAPRPAASTDSVDPVVLAPGEIRAGGALPVAAVFPTLGRYAVSGLQSLQGARLAVEDLNRAGGVQGRPLRLAEYRTGSYFVDARAAAAMAVRDGALAIVGANSSELSRAVAEVAGPSGVLQVTNVSTAADLTRDLSSSPGQGFVFRMCASDDVIGALLADFAAEQLGARSVAVLYEVGRTYSQRLARSFISRFRDLGAGRVAAEFFYLALETDFRPQLRRIQELRPDVLFVPGSFTDATLVAAQAEAVGLRATLLGGDAWSSPLLFRRGGPPREAYYVELCSPAPEFERRYEEAEGVGPPGCRAVLAYDAVRVVAAGLRSLGRLADEDLDGALDATRRRLRDAVARNEVEGMTGRIRFDVYGDRRQGVALYAVERRGAEPPRPRLQGWLGEP